MAQVNIGKLEKALANAPAFLKEEIATECEYLKGVAEDSEGATDPTLYDAVCAVEELWLGDTTYHGRVVRLACTDLLIAAGVLVPFTKDDYTSNRKHLRRRKGVTYWHA